MPRESKTIGGGIVLTACGIMTGVNGPNIYAKVRGLMRLIGSVMVGIFVGATATALSRFIWYP